MARNMGVKDLTVSARGRDEIRAVIRDGIRGAKGAMPGFKARFSEAELDALAAYVQALRTPENGAKP